MTVERFPPVAIPPHTSRVLLRAVIFDARVCRGRPSLGFQALLEVNLRLATTDYLSDGYNSLPTGVPLPVLLSRTVTSLLVCEVEQA